MLLFLPYPGYNRVSLVVTCSYMGVAVQCSSVSAGEGTPFRGLSCKFSKRSTDTRPSQASWEGVLTREGLVSTGCYNAQ